MNDNLHLHIPIQIISCTDTDGHVHPIRFRFSDENKELLTVPVDEVVSYRTTATQLIINVYAPIYNRRRLIEITYSYTSRNWYIDWIKS